MSFPYSDDFNRSDEELGASADWTERTGDHDVVSNQVENQTAARTSSNIASSIVTGADYWVEAVLNFEATGGGSFLGISGRRTDAGADENTAYYAYLRASANTIYIYEVANGSHTLLDSASTTINTATDYTVRLNMDGEDISADLDASVGIVSQPDSIITGSGDAGLIMADTGAVANCSWDSFALDTLAAPGVGGKSNPLYGPLGGPLYGPIG